MLLVRLCLGDQFDGWISPSGVASTPRPGRLTGPRAIENSRCGLGDNLYPNRKESLEAVRSVSGHEPTSRSSPTILSLVRGAMCGLTPSVPLPAARSAGSSSAGRLASVFDVRVRARASAARPTVHPEVPVFQRGDETRPCKPSGFVPGKPRRRQGR